MSSTAVVVAVLNLFVTGSGDRFGHYFDKYGRTYGVDPLLIAAVAYHESKFRKRIISRTNDYGMMQLHVSGATHEDYLGREQLLLEAKRNIRLGARMMSWWKAFHFRRCRSKEHHWLQHYNQGKKVSLRGWRGDYTNRVLKIYHRLLKLRSTVLREHDATS